MDTIDLQILELLKENGRATASEVSKVVRLSVPAVAERIRKLEQRGYIQNYTIKVDPYLFGYTLLAFLMVDLDETLAPVEEVREKMIALRNVLECHHIAGQYDYLLKVLVRDTKDLESFISTKLKKIRGVAASNTIICLSTLKEESNIREELI